MKTLGIPPLRRALLDRERRLYGILRGAPAYEKAEYRGRLLEVQWLLSVLKQAVNHENPNEVL